MADESHSVRGINWREAFPFTQIFRAFRVAIHPTKLILALAALLSIYLGGRVLDGLWPVSHAAVPNEIAEYQQYERTDEARRLPSFNERRRKIRDDLENDYARLLVELKIEPDDKAAHDAARTGRRVSDVKKKVAERRDTLIADARTRADNAKKDLKDPQAIRDVDNRYVSEVRQILAEADATTRSAAQITGAPIFQEFFSYEVAQANNVAWSVLANDWLGGFSTPGAAGSRPGVLKSISNFVVVGPWWLVRYHTTYFILFLVLFSIAWAIFGGAICRIAAVHVARDEKISLTNALRFSTGKFLSFIFAPIIPLLIVLVVGLVVMLGGLIGSIPVIGPILVGLLFFLAIAAGFVMTLVLLGTAGGFNLMYPTIAVEGSDSFDAISRSFSYVYARPWRMLFYSLVAVLYGALCFLFVRFFIQILLILTHYFVGAGMVSNVDGTRIPIDLWNVMWPAPASHGFTYTVDWQTLSGAQRIGAFLVAFWVYLTIGMAGAFAISFYFSASTIIYYLMRREVDATELDDVYLEQSDEDFGDTVTATTTAPVTPTTTPPPTATGGAQVYPAGDAPPKT